MYNNYETFQKLFVSERDKHKGEKLFPPPQT